MTTEQLVRRPALLRVMMVIACLTLAGCVTHRPIESQYESISAELKPGDRVAVELKNGQNLSFRVSEIREAEMTGRTGSDIKRGEMVVIQYADIEGLERVDDRPGLYFGSLIVGFILLLTVVFW